MKILGKILQVHFIIGLVLMVPIPAYAILLPSNTDLWEYTNFTGTPSSSGDHPVSDIRNMFGGNFGSAETDNTLFQDFQAAGFVHTASWETSSASIVRSIGFFAGHDNDANGRGISRFSLFGEDLNNGNNEVLLFEVFPSNPQYGDTPNNNHGFFLWLDEDMSNPILANRYRAEFVQTGPPSTASGPRIWELDAYRTFLDGSDGNTDGVIPEPGSLALLGIGLGASGLLRRRRKRT